MAEYDFWEALGRIAEFCQREEIEITGSMTPQRHGKVRGYFLAYSGSYFHVAAEPSEGRFRLQDNLDFVGIVESEMSQELVFELLNQQGEDPQEIERPANLAAKYYVYEKSNEIDAAITEARDEIGYFEPSLIALNMSDDFGRAIKGGQLRQGVYPRDETFSAHDFVREVQTLLETERELFDLAIEKMDLELGDVEATEASQQSDEEQGPTVDERAFQ